MYLNGVFTRVGDEGDPLRKLLLTIFFISVSGVLVIYHNIYPLYLTWETGFLAQIPLIFWPTILLAVISGISYCVLASSRFGISVIMSIVFILLNYPQYLFFNFTGGDSAGEISRWFSIRNLPRFSSESFTYFQWPLHFTFFEIYNKILGLPLMDTVRLSYLTLYVLFTISVFYFTFKYTSNKIYWLASSVYIIFMLMFLNNQLVPQLFALVILIFLFGVEKNQAPKSIYIQFFLYTLLVLSHPFFFVFYLLAISVYPIIKSSQIQLSEHGSPHDPTYSSLWKTILKPVSTIKGLTRNSFKYFKKQIIKKVILMSGIYLFLLEFQFPRFQQKFYNEFTGSISPHGSGSLLSRLREIILADNSAQSAQQETTLLYQLSSELLHNLSISTILAILVSLLLLSLVQLLYQRTEDTPIIPTSVAIAGGIYYVLGFYFPIIGPRAYQIALLPVGVFIVGQHLDRRIIKVLILVILVASPIIGVNIIINASIAGGGNTQNYHAHEVGEHIVQYDTNNRENIVKYPHSGLPPEFTFQQNQRITTTEEIILEESSVQSPSDDPLLIVFGPRQEHVAAHYRSTCNFRPVERNVIYDNKIAILADSNSVSGINCVSSG